MAGINRDENQTSLFLFPQRKITQPAFAIEVRRRGEGEGLAGGVCERGEGFAGYPSSALRYTVPLELWPNGGAVQQTLNGRANDAPNQAGPRGRGCPSPRPPPQNPRGPPALSPEPPLVLTTNYDNDKRHPRWTASEYCPGGRRPPSPRQDSA